MNKEKRKEKNGFRVTYLRLTNQQRSGVEKKENKIKVVPTHLDKVSPHTKVQMVVK